MLLSSIYEKLVTIPGSGFVQMPDGKIVDVREYRSFAERTFLITDVFPGSFNPLHPGHEAIFRHIGRNPVYELSIRRMGKDDLTEKELNARLSQFLWKAPVLITNAARFVEKCAIVPERVTWHVGIDTILRMKEDYGEVGIGGLNANFLVYSRILNGIRYEWPTGFTHIPANVQAAFYQNPDQLQAMSSTSIRENGRNP